MSTLSSFLFASLLLVLSTTGTTAHGSGLKCKCIPSLPFWPSQATWNELNITLSGRLIENVPVAAPCYPGSLQHATECASVRENHANASFLEQFPIGYWSGLNTTGCPLPESDSSGQTCDLGDSPVYTINATCWQDISAGIVFAKKHNLRLVIRDTGHDLLGRSTGLGSLQIWMRYLRTGIRFHESFQNSPEGGDEAWNGPAVTIGGGYTWADVNALAAARKIVVVGGGTPTVGCVGGYMQGGGHSFATHNYGLAADNVLQAQVVLADGRLVTASARENEELFFAIRGGGGGTYGVVVETTVKAWPDTNVVSQTLAFAPLTSHHEDSEAFMEVLTDLYQAFPALGKGEWSGYGAWAVNGPAPVFANFSTGYAHYAGNFNISVQEAQASFAPMLDKLMKDNGTRLIVSLQYADHPTYADFYSPSEPAAGTLGSTSSRFLDEGALLANRTALRETLQTLAGSDGEYTSNTNEFFGAAYGQVAADGRAKPVSGVNPAWRSMVVNHIVSRGWTQDTPEPQVEQIEHDVEYVKAAALKKLAPGTGTYMNEANFLDPDYQDDFYGSHYQTLGRIKRQLDPEDMFYCQTCVGSSRWTQVENGQLCRV